MSWKAWPSPLCLCVAARKMSDVCLGICQRDSLVAEDGHLDTMIQLPFHRLEVRQLRSARRVQACVMGPYFATPQLAIFMFVLVLVLTDQERDIRPRTVFMVTGMVQSMRLTCGMFFPMASQHLAETLVVLRRIQVLLVAC